MNNLNISIITTITNHSVYYATLASYFQKHKAQITFLGIPSVLDAVKHLMTDEGCHYQESAADSNVATMLSENKSLMASQNVLFLDEGYGRPNIYHTTLKSLPNHLKKIHTVHNVKTQLRPRFYLDKANMIDNHYRMRIMRRMDALLVCSPVLKDYIERDTFYGRPVFSIPFIHPRETAMTGSNNGHVTFSVPGGIHSKRRNYNGILDAFEELWKSNLPVSLKLVGTASEAEEDQQILAKCRRLREKYGAQSIVFFEERLSEEDFDANMRQTDVILSNLELNYDMTGTREVYGQTKESGITYHMLKYAKPALVPKDLVLMPKLQEQVQSYADAQELAGIVENLAEDRELLKSHAQNALSNTIYYQDYFDKQFTELYQFVVND